MSKRIPSSELNYANKELLFQIHQKEILQKELFIVNKELIVQNHEREMRAAELLVANDELVFQLEEKERRAEELIIANKELLYQNSEKEKRATELTAANKVLEQFTYIASHDLQEPLRTISNYMKVFEEDYLQLLDDNAAKYIHSINEATARMSILIKALHDYSRLGRKISFLPVDCNKLVIDVISDLDRLIKSSNAIIKVDPLPVLDISETDIRQVFQNLIINAVKFQKTDNQPIIHINCRKIIDKWKFSVTDNGIGIEPEHFERVFDIFQRLHTNEKEYKGNGIGLANCKRIIQLHQGEIWLESTPDLGSAFHFTIPNLSL
jgi:light-regulated signal transduction histidine kinase (bacteriophytochrome)